MFLLCFTMFACVSADTTSYAVLNIKSEQVGAADIAGLTDYLATSLSQALPQGRVYSWNDVEKMLENRAKLQTLGCDDEKCLSAIGGELGVDYLVSGSLAKIGDRSLLNLQLIDITKARICSRVSQSTSGNMGILVEALPEMVKKLIFPQNPSDTTQTASQPPPPVQPQSSAEHGVFKQVSLKSTPKAEPEIVASHQNMVRLNGGTIVMGSPNGEGDADEHPRPKVAIKAFWIDKTEVTQASYTALTKSNPSHWKGAELPLENVTWQEAADYCRRLGKRLPTEAEWEYAARAGSSTRYPWGKVAGKAWEYSWSSENSGKHTHAVATKKPNAFGIYDMIGNVSEWCSDEYQKTWYSQPGSKSSGGPDKGWGRVCRGGDWSSDKSHLRSATRDFGIGEFRRDFRGLRCVVDADSSDH